MKTVTIHNRFCGPRRSGNGGYAAGLFAQAAGGGVRAVTLRRPPPLDTPIDMREAGEGRHEARCGDDVIASVEPGEVSVDLPELPDAAGLAAARADYLDPEGPSHMLPFCFVCGPRRAAGDGLRIFAGPAPDSVVNADLWTPDDNLAAADGLVAAEYLWAALDCPGAFALRMGRRLALLGRFAVEIIRRPAPVENLVAAAWRTGEDGRKHFSSSALVDQQGALVAAANAVWIELNDPAMLARLRAENA